MRRSVRSPRSAGRCSAAVLAAAALATTVRDRDDVTTGLDIAKASGSHNRASDQLVHTIDFYEAVDAGRHGRTRTGRRRASASRSGRARRPASPRADYEVVRDARRRRATSWKGSIARKRDKGPRLRLGAVKVEQPSDTRIVMRVDPDVIKRPASYRWRAETTSFAQGLQGGTGCPDYAPDRPDTAETPLGKPRS